MKPVAESFKKCDWIADGIPYWQVQDMCVRQNKFLVYILWWAVFYVFTTQKPVKLQ